MKALSLTQPWASLVALGAKEVETRSWRSEYRGPLVIHAAKNYPAWARESAEEMFFHRALGGQHADTLPLGAGLCVVELLGCIRIDAAGTWAVQLEQALGHKPLADEIHFGNYDPGRYAWALRRLRVFSKPIPCRGSLSLWDWPAGLRIE